MDKKGLLLCVCQGTCPSFHEMNIFEVLNTIRRENLVDFVAIHPQLCAEAGCDPRMQQKMFKDAFKEASFNVDHHFPVDIRNMTTEQAVDAIKKLVQQN